MDPALGPAGLEDPGGRGAGEGGEPVDDGGAFGGAAAELGDLDDDSAGLGVNRQAGDAGLLDEVGGGADQPHVPGQRAGLARGRGGHGVTSAGLAGVTASLGTVPGRGMTFANEPGPRKNAAAPPSPAAVAGSSRSVPATRMPLTVR